MILLVCGGRKFASLYPSRAEGNWLPPEVLVVRRQQKEFLFRVLDAIHAKQPISLLIHGAATGADSAAGEWAKSRNVPVRSFPARWTEDGRAAGPKRNLRMLLEGKPDRTVGFPSIPDIPGKKTGTDDMLLQSKGHHVDTWSVSWPEGEWTHHL